MTLKKEHDQQVELEKSTIRLSLSKSQTFIGGLSHDEHMRTRFQRKFTGDYQQNLQVANPEQTSIESENLGKQPSVCSSVSIYNNNNNKFKNPDGLKKFIHLPFQSFEKFLFEKKDILKFSLIEIFKLIFNGIEEFLKLEQPISSISEMNLDFSENSLCKTLFLRTDKTIFWMNRGDKGDKGPLIDLQENPNFKMINKALAGNVFLSSLRIRNFIYQYVCPSL